MHCGNISLIHLKFHEISVVFHQKNVSMKGIYEALSRAPFRYTIWVKKHGLIHSCIILHGVMSDISELHSFMYFAFHKVVYICWYIRCAGENSKGCFYCKFLAESNSDRILKSANFCQSYATRLEWHTFDSHCIELRSRVGSHLEFRRQAYHDNSWDSYSYCSLKTAWF